MNAGSLVASRFVSLAAATYSHSSVVGRRLPSDSQYARAANHETFRMGSRSALPSPASRSLVQSFRYDDSAIAGLTALLRHDGCSRTKRRNSPRVTGSRSIENAATRVRGLAGIA